jgi:UDP-N-acetylmuramate dehydrogenase
MKLPDPKEMGNAGSFFKNPFITYDTYLSLRESYPDMPSFPGKDDLVKIPAAWLIEKCGWKGKRIGNAGVSEKHALIIVNYGNAKGVDIYNLSKDIISSVNEKFSIELEPEVNLIG